MVFDVSPPPTLPSVSAGPSSAPWATAVGGGSAFEPFAVEEQSTELKYLRDMYGKKVSLIGVVLGAAWSMGGVGMGVVVPRVLARGAEVW